MLCLRIILTEMRPMIEGDKGDSVGNLMEKQSLAVVKELWDAWEIHCLILASLFLQVFLFIFASMRRHSVSWVLRTLLWLVYLSADSVAIFVLGHLAVNASEQRHQLISFWAPFLLVHLGGQDTITALSKQDNELWLRHLLSLVTQVAGAGYVVAKASWSDRRLTAAMVLMFISGCFKYAERTYCLYRASPGMLRSKSLHSFSRTVHDLQRVQGLAKESQESRAIQKKIVEDNMRSQFSKMLKGCKGLIIWGGWGITDIMSVDAPLNEPRTVIADDLLPDLLAELLSEPGRYRSYEYVGARLVSCYQRLYTKSPLREALNRSLSELIYIFSGGCIGPVVGPCIYALFQCVLSSMALVLFAAAEKGDKVHTSRADIIVSYILLVGAVFLDVASSMFSVLSYLSLNPPDGKIGSAILRVANCIQPAWSQKQWAEELAQYSIIKRYAVPQDSTVVMSFVQLWISKLFGAWGTELFDTIHTSITRDRTPIKEFILDNLLCSGKGKEWSISSTRGLLALQKWMPSSQDSDSALYKCTGGCVDFPTSVLIWHIATEICYYYGDSANTNSEETKKHILVSRQLSNYIMYLMFKCGVMLTTNSQLVHDNVHGEIRNELQDKQVNNLSEKEVVMNLFRPKKKDEEDSVDEEPVDGDNEGQHSSTEEIRKYYDDTINVANSSHVQKFLENTLDALDSPVLPRARAMAQELISIKEEIERWRFIAMVWSEMIFYIAPRCGGAFHYEHLSTGGEFVTHILLLMQSLGPFLPTPGAST